MDDCETGEYLVKLEDARKTYRMGDQDVKALAGIDFHVSRGSFWAIMGASGSGKSTMRNRIGCLDRLSTGRCRFDGLDVGALDDDALSSIRLRKIGFIFQSFNLIPQLSVQRNIELPMYYMGLSPSTSASRAIMLAGKVGLSDRLNHTPAELSGGQMQRVALARALANDPELLLADEPTGNLDSATGLQVMDLLVEINREGKTIIMVTHEQDIAGFASSRLHMKDGLICDVMHNC